MVVQRRWMDYHSSAQLAPPCRKYTGSVPQFSWKRNVSLYSSSREQWLEDTSLTYSVSPARHRRAHPHKQHQQQSWPINPLTDFMLLMSVNPVNFNCKQYYINSYEQLICVSFFKLLKNTPALQFSIFTVKRYQDNMPTIKLQELHILHAFEMIK